VLTSCNSTSLLALRKKIRFALFPFHSPFTQGIAFCFLFLPLLRCFTSGGSSSFRSWPKPANRIRRSQGQPLRASNLGLSQLGTSFVSSQSQAIHQVEWCQLGLTDLLNPVVVSSYSFMETVRSSSFIRRCRSNHQPPLFTPYANKELHGRCR